MYPDSFYRPGLLRLAMAIALGALIGGVQAAPEAASGDTGPVAGTAQASSAPGDAAPTNRIVREGVNVELNVAPAHGGPGKVMAADWADLSFRLTDASTGEPLQGRYPAAWMDLAKAWKSRGESPMTCRERVSTFLKGIVGVRPMIDLNSHYLLVMNRDASISVIDPAVGISGITNLFAQVVLERPAADWVKTRDQQRLFVTMPMADKVAVVDTELFKVSATVEAGDRPTRAELQTDERYLWVGNNTGKAETSGVSVIDTASLERAAFIPTGPGHHEIAFSDDDRYAFVTNRDGGTVSVIDVRTLQKVKDLETGPVPIAAAFSLLSKALYVADGKDGTISVVDPARLEVRARIEAKPGLGPLRFSDDGRWGMAVNPVDNNVYVIDASTDKLVHTVPVGSQPYQLSFTRQYAYVRSLGSEQVGLIPLGGLDDARAPSVTYFPAGQGAPGGAREVSIADSIIPSVKEAAAYIVNQAEGTVYYYMEGMNAPMGSFRNYGHEARAIEIADRSIAEREPGLYTGRVKIPVAGTYDIAFVMDSPRFIHCFSTEVEPNPEVRQAAGPMGVEFQIAQRAVPIGGSAPVRFKLSDPVTGEPKADIPDVTVLYYASDGRDRTVVPASVLGGGVYEASVTVRANTTYYVFVGAESEQANYTDLPYATLMGVKPAPTPDPGAQAQGGEKP